MNRLRILIILVVSCCTMNAQSPCNPTIHKVKSENSYAAHNPAIYKVDSLYALFFIMNTGIDKHPSNQFICPATSKSLNGPWEMVGENGKILTPPNNPKKPDTDQWIKAAKDAGCKIAILTATHETGFTLYQVEKSVDKPLIRSFSAFLID
ncbi:MAG: hypothetical protein ACK5HT_09415 [Draconibacterium sp.]